MIQLPEYAWHDIEARLSIDYAGEVTGVNARGNERRLISDIIEIADKARRTKVLAERSGDVV